MCLATHQNEGLRHTLHAVRFCLCACVRPPRTGSSHQQRAILLLSSSCGHVLLLSRPGTKNSPMQESSHVSHRDNEAGLANQIRASTKREWGRPIHEELQNEDGTSWRLDADCDPRSAQRGGAHLFLENVVHEGRFSRAKESRHDGHLWAGDQRRGRNKQEQKTKWREFSCCWTTELMAQQEPSASRICHRRTVRGYVLAGLWADRGRCSHGFSAMRLPRTETFLG